MKLTTLTLSLSALSGMIGIAMADNCYGPWNWCGWDLIRHGNYEDYIRDKLAAAGKPTDEFTINNSLWHCVGNDGEADFVAICTRGCVYGGSAQSNDYCAPT
ncbi:hypothetical protein VTN00DRAFT_4839 [Thermoascus crustaceus]|uniref:uncharacterized protein n=1 Tax=Thermoascus crustaceus TaxID=5088 RepID=UPI003742BC23